MDKNTLLTRIAAIVSSLREQGTPESMLYIFCDMNMDDYQTIRGILIRAGLVKIAGHYVMLTPKGIETAKQIDSALVSKG